MDAQIAGVLGWSKQEEIKCLRWVAGEKTCERRLRKRMSSEKGSKQGNETQETRVRALMRLFYDLSKLTL